LLVAGRDGRGVCLSGHGAVLELVSDLDRAADDVELAADLRHVGVAGDEAEGGVDGVDGPGAGGEVRGQCSHGVSYVVCGCDDMNQISLSFNQTQPRNPVIRGTV